MDYETIKLLVEEVQGCTFATIDSETWSNKTVRCVAEGERVIIFRTKGGSGYENMVKRRLAEAGKNPDNFRVGPLPWGSRVDDLPLVEHKGEFYLQFIRLDPGKRIYYLGVTGNVIDPEDLYRFGVKSRNAPHQGLSPSEQVIFCTYRVDHIKRIVMMGADISETKVIDRPRRVKLRLAFNKGE